MLSLSHPVVSQQFHLQPQQLTVLQGSEVRFNATVEGAWQLMTWTVGGLLVLTVSSNNTVTAPTGQFTARYCSAGDPSCVEFTIHNATRRQSGSVICAVLGPYGSRTAQLSVQGKVINLCQASYICLMTLTYIKLPVGSQ